MARDLHDADALDGRVQRRGDDDTADARHGDLVDSVGNVGAGLHLETALPEPHEEVVVTEMPLCVSPMM